MIDADVFRNHPTLTGEHVRLEPLTPAVLTDYLATLDDREVQRLTGSHEHHDPDHIAQWPATDKITTTGPTGLPSASPTACSSAKP